VNAHLDFLLSVLYDDCLAPEHLADLRKSGLTDETIRLQKIRTVPPHMIDQLLGFRAPDVQHAYLIPFPDPRGGWFDHVRMKIFPALATPKGTIKYLQPKRSGVRIYFPLATLDAVLHSSEPLYVCEGEKKSLSVAQTGLPTVGICGIEGWHLAGAAALHPDLDDVGLRGRRVNVIADGDVRTNPFVSRAVRQLGAALAARGAESKLVLVPEGYKGIDDYLAATA
jgi:Domain of unknown function (DUF3854)